jgi:tRNA(Phe) wybutosine-synthesizing methylase Tyw3
MNAGWICYSFGSISFKACVILFFQAVTNGNRKKGCKWLFTSHENVKEDDLLNSVDPNEGNNILKYEPLILHVQCRTLESAKLLVSVHRLKNSF